MTAYSCREALMSWGRCLRQKTNLPRKTPNTKTPRKIKTAMTNRTFAIDFAPDATPLKPKKPAINEITKKRIAHFSMLVPSTRLGGMPRIKRGIARSCPRRAIGAPTLIR